MSSYGTIITFYSYKGGVGRTMALANTAWLLASNGHRVLTIDWDLEAPGLPRFFDPFIGNHVLATSHGLIDLLTDHVEEASYSSPSVPSIAGDRTAHPSADVSNYIVPLQWHFPGGGIIDLMPAGRPGPSYARRVSQFDWSQLYSRFGGRDLIERIKSQVRDRYDYVLVDSRTGINETAGVCTVQMADTLVLLFTLNRQSLQGTAWVAESVEAQRRSGAHSALRIFPIPTRVEMAEKEKLEAARQQVAARFDPFLSHIASEEIPRYWSSVEIPYVPFYSYEEVLCAFGDSGVRTAGTMSSSIERLAAYLTDGKAGQLPAIEPAARQRVLDAFSHSTSQTAPEVTCFISYSSKDATFVERFRADLENCGIRCWFAAHDLPIGAKIRSGIDKAIHDHQRVVVILSESSIASTWVEKEVETAFEWEAVTGRATLVPIRLDDAILRTEQSWAADIRRQRNIGDFTGWQDRRSYREAFARLVTSLMSTAAPV